MIDQIKEIVKNYLNAIKPARLVPGTIETVSPLTVRVNEKLIIPEDLIIWPPSLNPEAIGKKVLMIRQEGGQQYYVLEVK